LADDPTHGSGLRGLSDRVSALDGRLELTRAEDGTTVKAGDPVRAIVADDSVFLRVWVTRLLEKAGFSTTIHLHRVRKRASSQDDGKMPGTRRSAADEAWRASKVAEEVR
jgi:hypothetical protein